MMTRTQFLLSVSAVVTLFASASSAIEPIKKGKALDIAMAKFMEHRTEITSLPMECVYFVDEKTKVADHLVDVTVREKHNSKCGGDPNVEPTLTTLRVDTKTGKVSVYDAVEDKYHSLK